MTEPVRPAPVARSAYRAFRPLSTRWSDNDVYGHMNNVVHYALFDTAVNGWLIEAGLLDLTGDGPIGLVVETQCSYFAEMAYPDRVAAGIAVERLGRSSVAYSVGLFRNDEAVTAARGRFVHVYVDRKTRRPMPLGPGWRAALKTLSP